MRIYDNVDLQKNQLRNVVLESVSSDPDNGREGQVIYNTDEKHAKLNVGAEFKQFALKDDVLEAVANADFSKFQVVSEKPEPAKALENIFYLVYNTDTLHYDIYAKIGDSVVWIDDTTIDLSEYAKTADVDKKLDNKVDKEDGYGLSQEDFTYEDEIKLSTIEDGADVNVIEAVKVNGVELPITEEDKSVDITLTVESADKNVSYIFVIDSKDNGINLTINKKEG